VVLFQLGMNVALDTVKPEWRDPEYGHRVKQLRRLHRAEPGRPLVVVLGSSRTQMGFAPSLLGTGTGPTDPLVYNLSQAGCGPLHELLNLHRLLADGVTPDFLLVEVLSPVLAGDGPAEQVLKAERLSLADVRRAEPYCRDSAELWESWAKARALPWYTLRQYLMSHWQGGLLHWSHRHDFMWKKLEPDGWLPYFYDTVSDADRAAKLAEAKAQYAGYFAGEFRVAPLPDRVYRDLLAVCRDRGIRVGFVVMPESPTFRAFYPPAARTAVADYLAGLTRDHGVPVFDARDWLPDGAFADGHHLMRHGAEAFSRRFGTECAGPWLPGEKR
jgi:hypothetical protein